MSKRIYDVRTRQGLAKSKNFFVPNGVHLNEIIHLPSEKVFRDSFVYVGHLKKEKGIHSIVTSMPRIVENFPCACLIVIGDGPYRGQLESLINELNLQNHVSLLGSMSNENILKEIGQYGIGLAPYTDEDYNFYCSPVKVKEYLAAGCPVIITNVPDISFDVSRYDLGFVVDEKNFQEEFTLGAIKLLENPELCDIYKRNALNYASKFDWDAIYEQVFRKVLA